MFKLIAGASVPLIMALGTVFGYDLDEAQVVSVVEALVLVIGAAGSVAAVALPSLKAKLKFGKDAK